MRSDFSKVWRFLNTKERRQLTVVAVTQVFSGLMDMAGVASIVPFLSVVANPELLSGNDILFKLKNWTAFTDQKFMITLGLLAFGALLLNQVVRLGSAWYGQVVTHEIWWNLHKRMFRYYLNQPYLYHLQHHSNALLEKLQMRLNVVVAGIIRPLFLLISSFFTILFLLIMLIWVKPMITLVLAAITGAFYILLYQKVKSRLEFYGKIGPEFSSKSFKLIGEAFGAIKEIKVRRNGKYYVESFDPHAKRYCDAQVKIHLFSTMPGGMVEILAFGGILLITLLLLNSSQEFQYLIPTIGLYAFSLQRILPAIQSGYQQISVIKFYQSSLEVIYADLVAAFPSDEVPLTEPRKNEGHRPYQRIELKDLSFAYPKTTRKVLDSVSLTIPAGSMIGIAGPSGAGKTTLIDLILGLFETGSGNILIDGQPLIGETLSRWQASLGYVPQAGFIADDTIARNIAFGLHNEEIEMERVKQVAEIAQISEFIESELVQQYATFVGERGVRFSGGQRQRLRIARALYHDPDTLILDEATSALDGITEEKVMDSIRNLLGQKTILLIAHRLTTLKECDTIFLLEGGKVIDQGTYQFLIDTNMTFKHMAREAIEKKV